MGYADYDYTKHRISTKYFFITICFYYINKNYAQFIRDITQRCHSQRMPEQVKACLTGENADNPMNRSGYGRSAIAYRIRFGTDFATKKIEFLRIFFEKEEFFLGFKAKFLCGKSIF